MGQIFLVRHAQASFGSDDYDRLSDLGFRQAEVLGRWFESCGLPVDRVIAGAMRRHRETATGCLREFVARGVPRLADLMTDARLNEFDHVEIIDVYKEVSRDPSISLRQRAGHPSSIPSAQLQHLFSLAMERWMSAHRSRDYRESWPQFRERCIDAFETLVDGTHPAKAQLVFTSGGVIAAICQHLLDLTDKATREMNWSLANTGVTRVLFTKGRRGLGCLNSTAHFDWARRPDLRTYR